MESIDIIKNRIRSIKNKLDELAVISEVYEAEQILDEIKKRIDKTKEEIEDIENDDSSFSKPLLSSLKSEKTDLEIYEKKYNSQVEIWGKKRRQEELLKGNLTGADAKRAEREMGLENLKEVDNQGLIIDSIGENIKGANNNLVNINNELQNQGEQMNRIQKTTLETENEVKKTGNIMGKMERRAKCLQIITFFAVIVFGLFDVVWAIYLLILRK